MCNPKLSPLSGSLPAIRACIFDMDGLLINSEDIITLSINQLLVSHGRPPLTPSIRAQLMGVPDSSNNATFHAHAQLPIPRDKWARDSKAHMRRLYPESKPLPGAAALLANLGRAGVELGLASSTSSESFALKTARPETRRLLDVFSGDRRILGDDPRLRRGRGKPAPDIYLLALEAVNASLGTGGEAIRPSECLVFEDSVAGVEAGRRAGMRVVWVPHADVACEYQARYGDILAGRSGVFEVGDDWQLGLVDDGWAEHIPSLEHFDYERYGIHLPS